MKKKLLVILLTVVSCLALALGLAACGRGEENVNGMYYSFIGNTVYEETYIKLEDGKWNDSLNASGTYTLKGKDIILYDVAGDYKREKCRGTLQDGVLSLNIMGVPFGDYKKIDKDNSSTDNNGDKPTGGETGDKPTGDKTVELQVEGFEGKGNVFYNKVSHNTQTYSLFDKITVSKGADYRIYSNPTFEKILTESVDLQVGDNLFYVLVTNGNNIEIYSLNVYRRQIYTVNFVSVSNGNECAPAQQVEEDGFATCPEVVIKGYTCVSWNFNFEKPITGNTIIYPELVANEYTVTFLENGGEKLEESTKTVTYMQSYTLPVPVREGYSFAGWYFGDTRLDNNSGAPWGQNYWTYAQNVTVTAHWQINPYRVSVDSNNLCAVSGADIYNFATEATVQASAVCLGYRFVGWYNGDSLVSTNPVYTFQVPANNVALIAKCEISPEMQPFMFGATAEACTVTGLKDKSATEIVIPDFVTSIGREAFSECSSLTSVTIPNSVTTIGESAFAYCRGLTELTIPNSVTSIGSSAFWHCNFLMSVMIGNGVTSIGSSAFRGCSSLTSVVIPNSVTSIGSSVFVDCSSLTSVTIGNGVTSIGSFAFSGCRGLTSVTIPNSVTAIGDSVFAYCSSLTSVTIGNGVTSIGLSAFEGCSGLTSVVIPNSVTSIWTSAFSGCSGLTCVTIGNGVTLIGREVFRGCRGLTELTIPDSVTTIEDSAFSGCSGLTRITYQGTIAQWKAILKHLSWNNNMSDYTVYCTDGTIAKDGTETKYKNV